MKRVFKITGIITLLLSVALAFPGCSAPAPSDRGDNRSTGYANANNAATTAAATTAAPATTVPPVQNAVELEASTRGDNAEQPREDASRYAQSDNTSKSQRLPSSIPFADEEYLPIDENVEKAVALEPTLTFSLKVDTASYTNVARYINSGNLPPPDAVRIEEMINYFSYDEILPVNSTPFSIYTEVGPSPFDANKEMAFIRVKSRELDRTQLPNSNLTFLIDTSGSMDSYDKLPLLKSAFAMLVENLTADDVISIVTYAGNASIVLDSVRGDQKKVILDAIYGLKAGGGTAGSVGINTAYRLAEKNYAAGANNRVILATDGDFNVGVSSVKELERLISNKRETGVYLTILGFGTENLKDNKMETLAKNGNGNYSYIDSMATADKVLVEELGSNLFVIADDVKAQIEFNPAQVMSYRLIGYENRMLANKDFANDKKDAGEIGVGTDVVLLFEIMRTNANQGSKYRQSVEEDDDESSVSMEYYDELFEIRIRYKDPGAAVSNLITSPIKVGSYTEDNSSDFIFAVSVAGFGQLLNNSPYAGDITVSRIAADASQSLGKDLRGYRKDFVDLVGSYSRLTGY